MTVDKKIFMVALFLLGISARLLLLTMDAPVPVPADGAFHTDQGWHSHSVINKLYTGTWFFSLDRNEITHMPLFQFVQYAAVKAFGIHLWVYKLQALFASLLLILLSFYVLRRVASSQFALWVASALVINYLHIVYAGAALVEPTVALWVFCGSMCWWTSAKRSVWLAAVAGLFCFLGIATKTHGIYMVVVIAAAVITDFLVLERAERGRLIKRVVLFSITLGCMYLLWKKIWIEPHYTVWKNFGGAHISNKVPVDFFTHLVKYVRQYTTGLMDALFIFSIRMPVLLALAIIGMYVVVREALHKNYSFFRTHKLFGFSVIWLTAGVVFFILARYVRPRFQMMLVVPLIMTAVYIVRLRVGEVRIKTVKDMLLYSVLVLPVISIVIFKIFSVKTPAPLALKITSGIVLIGIFSLYFKGGIMLMRVRKFNLLPALYVVLQCIPLLFMVMHRDYTTIAIGRDIRTCMIEDDKVDSYVVGPLSPTFALEGGFRTLSGIKCRGHRDIDTLYKAIQQKYAPAYHLTNVAHLEKSTLGHYRLRKTYVYRVAQSSEEARGGTSLYLYAIDH